MHSRGVSPGTADAVIGHGPVEGPFAELGLVEGGLSCDLAVVYPPPELLEACPMLLSTRIHQIRGSDSVECPRWPPDLFAICASLLRESGAYERVVALDDSRVAIDDSRVPDEQRPASAQDIAKAWRKSLDDASSATRISDMPVPPAEVAEIWTELLQGDHGLHRLRESETRTVTAVVKLLAIADETCVAFGIRTNKGALAQAQYRLVDKEFRSLCWEVDVDAACVLPKQHTPQRGMTLRSLTHHLALIPPSGVSARWHPPHQTIESELERLELLNILVLPWPEEIERSAFTLVPSSSGPYPRKTGRFRFFEYQPPADRDLGQRVKAAISRAEKIACDIDIVVMPELAITEEQLEEVLEVCRASRCAFVGGVASKAADAEAAEDASPTKLHIVCKTSQEWTADGRGDGGCAYFPRLSSWTAVKV